MIKKFLFRFLLYGMTSFTFLGVLVLMKEDNVFIPMFYLIIHFICLAMVAYKEVNENV